jgi:hypothetical protein
MRWLARILALIALGLFVLFAVQGGVDVLGSISFLDPQGVPLLVALVVALAGALIAWRWELVGGIMTIVGAVAIIGLVCLGSGADMFLCSLFFTLPLLLSGALYLACCWRTRELAVVREA